MSMPHPFSIVSGALFLYAVFVLVANHGGDLLKMLN
jgi:hypothetical protein